MAPRPDEIDKVGMQLTQPFTIYCVGFLGSLYTAPECNPLPASSIMASGIESATGTGESFLQSNLHNMVKRSIFSAKQSIKLLELSSIRNGGNGVSRLFYDHNLHLVVG